MTIDIEARLAQFQDSLDKIGKEGEKVGKRLERAFSGFQSALGVLGVSLSAGAFVGFIKGGLDAASALDDLSEKTSLSVETLSQLQGLTRITGADLDQVAATAGRFARSVGEAVGGNTELVKAFRDVGISVEDLRSKNFDELYITFAKSIAEAENQQAAFAVGAKLAGRNVQESLPFYKDLASIGLEAATVTSEQAAQAEKLQNEFRKLNKETAELQTQLALLTAGPLAKLVEGVKFLVSLEPGQALAALFVTNTGVYNLADEPLRKIEEIDRKLKKLREDRAVLDPNRGGFAGFRNSLNELAFGDVADIDRQIAVFEKARAAVQKIASTQIAALPPLTEPPGAGGGGRIGNSSLNTGAEAAAAKELAERERVAKLIQAGEEEFERERLEALKFYSDARNRQLEEQAQAETERWRAVWEQYDREQEEAIEQGRVLLEGLNAEAAKDADFARDLGLTFVSAFEDAIVKGESFRDVLRGVGQDLVRLATRKAVTEPLLQAFAPIGAGIGSFLKGLIPSFDVGTPYVPRDTLAMVHKGERIIPADQNKPGAMGGTYYIDARGADATGLARLERTIREINGSIEQRAVAAVVGARNRNPALLA